METVKSGAGEKRILIVFGEGKTWTEFRPQDARARIDPQPRQHLRPHRAIIEYTTHFCPRQLTFNAPCASFRLQTPDARRKKQKKTKLMTSLRPQRMSKSRYEQDERGQQDQGGYLKEPSNHRMLLFQRAYLSVPLFMVFTQASWLLKWVFIISPFDQL